MESTYLAERLSLRLSKSIVLLSTHESPQTCTNVLPFWLMPSQ